MNSETEQIFLLNPTASNSLNILQKADAFSESTQVNLENVEDFSNVCRTCATITEFVIPIFEGEGLQNNLADKIHKHLPIQVTEQDLLPRVVCYQCASTLLAWHELVQCCVQADTALRTRLAELKPVKCDTEHSLDKEQQLKFNEIADFVARSLEPPPPEEGSPGPPAPPPPGACAYCGAELAAPALKAHLIATHLELLFHCDECDTYVDRKDFILHMSLHAARYATADDKSAARKPKKRIEDGGRRAAPSNPGDQKNADEESSRSSESGGAGRRGGPGADSPAGASARGGPEGAPNDFSDHSDGDYEFGPLPESVFRAIEDSQESQSAEDGAQLLPPNTDTPGEESVPSETNLLGEESVPSEANLPGEESVPSEANLPGEVNSPGEENLPSEENVRANNVTPPEAAKKPKKRRACPTCGKVYTASSSYFYHVKYSHRGAGAKQHECGACGARLATKAGLAQHAAALHGGGRPYACRHCAAAFRSRASHYIHEQTHTGAKAWACERCGRAFRWRTHLLRHARRHAAERAHACAACGRAFSVRADLLRHERTHAAGDFACDECGARFAQLRYLKVHVHKKHSARPPPGDAVNALPP